MYGILISLGSIAAFFISEKALKRRDGNLRLFYKITNIAILAGIAGARAYHVIDYWQIYKTNPLLIPQVWKGGMGIFGALIGASVAIIITLKTTKNNKLSILEWMDIAVLGIPLAQALGRWGNFFNKELVGKETSLAWGILLEGKRYHPLFLYESILNLILFLILINLENKRRKLKKGFIFFSYLVGYGVIRFSLEFLRMRSWSILGVNIAQAISLLIILVGMTGMYYKKHETADKNEGSTKQET